MPKITEEELEYLQECEQKLNAVFELMTAEHTISIGSTGEKARDVSMTVLADVTGYLENERYFDAIKRRYKEKVGDGE